MEHGEAVQWVAGLGFAAVVLAFGELLTPFFFLGTVSIGCLIAAAVIAFQQGPAFGAVVLGATLAGLVLFAWFYFNVLPRTRVGRRLMPELPDAGTGDGVPHLRYLESLVGRTGQAASPLRPVGAVEFDGRRIDCEAETGLIDRGCSVRVISVEGQRVLVRAV